MNIMNIHIDETLAERDIKNLKQELSVVPHVINVEFNSSVPHDLTVECEEHHNMPVIILDKLARHGLHPDIQYC